MKRRQFLATTLSAVALTPSLLQAEAKKKTKAKYEFCAFEKPLQFLSYDDLADLISELGYDGIEATVRPNGHVLPEKVEEDLPRLHEALAKRQLKIHVVTSGINSTTSPHAEKVLKTSAKLGIKQYRMDWYRYDLKKPIQAQLDEFKPQLAELAALNKQLGIQGLYQNHSGWQFVGAPLWDLYSIMKDLDPAQIALAFDIRHATVEGGLSWPIQFKLVRSHIGAIFLKDFVWENNTVKSVPFGTGMVDPKYFAMLKETGFSGTVSVHVEYLPAKSTDKKVIADALRTDLVRIKQLLG